MADRLTCDFPGCTTELVYSGRGRPPKRCSEHKSVKNQNQEEKVTPAARPRPGASKKPEGARPAPPRVRSPQDIDAKNEAKGKHLPEGIDEGLKKLPATGSHDVQSRAKADTAGKRTQSQNPEAEQWPIGSGGRPMIKIAMAASELIPTGQYANVSVGPAQIHAFVDLDRGLDDGVYFTDAEKDVMKSALNELAETVERDVVAVQRNLVLESMQEQLSTNGK